MGALMLAEVGVDPWAWHLHVDVWVLIGLLAFGYPVVVRRFQPAKATISPRQTRLYYAGVFALWLGADWPIHDIAERYLLSVHMLQHLLFTLVAPALLLLGVPPWLLSRILRPLGPIVRRLTHPVAASVLFNGVVVVTHWPALVDLALRREAVHFAIHVVLVGSALVMWLPVFSTVREVRRMSDPARMLYLFLQSVVPTVPASFLTFAEGPIYRFYADAPRIWGISIVGDQQLAGAVMKLGGGMLLWGVIVTMFFRWYQREQRDKVADVLTWDDVQRQLEATEAAAPQES